MWNIVFFKILGFTIFFIFNFVYLYLSKNSRNFYVFLFYRLEILSKNFEKSWNVCQKNKDIWNPKFFINSIVYYLLFLFFWHYGNVFCLFHLSKLVKKILNIFVVLYCMDYTFYKRILENSWIFIKKIEIL